MQHSTLLTLFLTLIAPLFAAPAIPNPALPIVVLVPGAWHSPVHYLLLISKLTTFGYHTVTGRLPSCDSADPNDQSAAKDAAYVRDALIMPHLNAGRKVILAMHSYGGCPGATAGHGLSVTERQAAGLPGGVVGIVFIAAFLAKEGQSLLSSLPGKVFDPWVVQYPNGQLGVSNPTAVFYGETKPSLAKKAVAELRFQSRNSLSTPGGAPAWADTVFENRRAYFVTTNDHSIPTVAQEAMLAATGVKFTVGRFDSDHSPFLSHTNELANWMVTVMEPFMNGDLLGNYTGAMMSTNTRVNTAVER